MDYLKEAREYLQDRLATELSFQNNLEDLIDRYSYKLVDIAYSSNIPSNVFTFTYNKYISEKVDSVIDEMQSLIETMAETLAVADHKDNKDKILTYISKDLEGENFYDRLDNHIKTFRKETEGIIAASLLIGTSKSVLKQNMSTYRKMPYLNPIFKDAVKLNKGKASVLKNGGLHLGVGVSNCAYNSINTLGQFTIADAWQRNWYDDWDRKGVIGYYVITQSGACGTCSTNAGFHSDGNLCPYHVNCRCLAVPVFKKID